jgi:hypothetical protein
MKPVLVLLVCSFVVGACGSVEEPSGGGAGSTSEREGPTQSVADEPAEAQSPPTIILVSEAGEQEGVQGSSCVTTPTVGLCTDTPDPDPEALSVVRPGETVEIVVEGATTVDGKVHVVRLGCRKELLAFRLAEPTTRWAVSLEPGVYELDVFVRFEGEDKSGDTFSSLGLLVDDSVPLEIVPAAGHESGCGQSK